MCLSATVKRKTLFKPLQQERVLILFLFWGQIHVNYQRFSLFFLYYTHPQHTWVSQLSSQPTGSWPVEGLKQSGRKLVWHWQDPTLQTGNWNFHFCKAASMKMAQQRIPFATLPNSFNPLQWSNWRNPTCPDSKNSKLTVMLLRRIKFQYFSPYLYLGKRVAVLNE